jgi:hypothetical protein
VQLVSASTKSRRKFYTQVEHWSFHTAWTLLGHPIRGPQGVCGWVIYLWPRRDVALDAKHIDVLRVAYNLEALGQAIDSNA